jgi:hypothetical protein
MNTDNAVTEREYCDPAKWHNEDTVWVLGLFGTAIGAGVLFLPINAGIGGFGRCLSFLPSLSRLPGLLTVDWRDSFMRQTRPKAALPMLLVSNLVCWQARYLPLSISSPCIPF